MKEKKLIVFSVVILLLVLVGAVGASYAYFATVNKIIGNDKNLNIVTENLGDIKWDGTKVYTSGDLLPGECGIQTFTIEKNSASGKGIYEIDLKGILDESFGSDVEITLYKTVDTTTNNVTIKEGSSTISGDTTKQYYKEDSVVVSGTPEKIYGTKALQDKEQIILEQANFDNSTFSKTTYYLVYCYKNADTSQDEQQGKSFSGEISVRLILDKLSLTEYVEQLTVETTIDDYGNTRYIGKDPNNYISVDGDIWRIIGTMKDIDDGTGTKSDRVKIIRAKSIGSYSWDTSDSSVNSGYGVNEWSEADLMKLLNPGYESESVGGSLYWNNQSGTCYYGQNNGTISCNFTSIGIGNELKALIKETVWNTGVDKNITNFTTQNFYMYEHSSNNEKICTSGSYCNDDLARTTTWKGLVGLMYPSDYGYATGGNLSSRQMCLKYSIFDWRDDLADCYLNNWIYNGNTLYTMSSVINGTYASNIFYITSLGSVYNSAFTYYSYAVHPVVYLKNEVKIISGTGSSSDPFVLGI